MPPLIFVPAAAVINDRTWQVAHPILSKSSEPFLAGSFRKLRVARGSFCRSHKASEAIDIGEPVRIRLVIWLGSGITELCHLVRKQPVRDSHFIEISIARKRQQACLLILPTEPPDAGLARASTMEHTAPDRRFCRARPCIGRGKDRLEPGRQPLPRSRRPGDSVICAWSGLSRCRNPLLNLRVGKRLARTNGAKVHERAAGDGFGSVSDGDFRVLETLVRSKCPTRNSVTWLVPPEVGF